MACGVLCLVHKWLFCNFFQLLPVQLLDFLSFTWLKNDSSSANPRRKYHIINLFLRSNLPRSHFFLSFFTACYRKIICPLNELFNTIFQYLSFKYFSRIHDPISIKNLTNGLHVSHFFRAFRIMQKGLFHHYPHWIHILLKYKKDPAYSQKVSATLYSALHILLLYPKKIQMLLFLNHA